MSTSMSTSHQAEHFERVQDSKTTHLRRPTAYSYSMITFLSQPTATTKYELKFIFITHFRCIDRRTIHNKHIERSNQITAL